MKLGTKYFSSGEAHRITRVASRTIDFWARTGLVVPSVQAAGTGSIRLYSLDDLLWLATVNQLRCLGVTPAICRDLHSEFSKRPLRRLRHAVALAEVSVDCKKLALLIGNRILQL